MQLIPSMLDSGLQSSFWCHDSYCITIMSNNIIFRVEILFILRKPHAMRQWWSTMVKKKNTDKIMLNEDALLPHSTSLRLCWVFLYNTWIITLGIYQFTIFISLYVCSTYLIEKEAQLFTYLIYIMFGKPKNCWCFRFHVN